MKVSRTLLLTLLVTSCAGAVPAGNSVVWGNGYSIIKVEETPNDPEGCDGRVYFVNKNVHSAYEENKWDLDFKGGKVKVQLFVDVYGPDTLSVVPPEGYLAKPYDLTVPEDDEGSICIYQSMEVLG